MSLSLGQYCLFWLDEGESYHMGGSTFHAKKRERRDGNYQGSNGDGTVQVLGRDGAVYAIPADRVVAVR